MRDEMVDFPKFGHKFCGHVIITSLLLGAFPQQGIYTPDSSGIHCRQYLGRFKGVFQARLKMFY